MKLFLGQGVLITMTPEDVTFIKNILRQGTIKWPGRAECLRRARKKVFVRVGKRGQNIYKYFWQCAICKEWFRDVNSMEVDHIEEIGPFTGDWNDYIARVFSPQSNLQALCTVHHLAKTLRYSSARARWKRKR